MPSHARLTAIIRTIGGTIEKAPIFSDVSNTSWYYNAVSFVYNKSLFSGATATTFEPDTAMTRAMFVTVLYRLAGQPQVSASSSFSDVTAPSAYYYSAVVWGGRKTVSSLVIPMETYRPDQNITREQMASIMYRYAQYAGYNIIDTGDAAYNSFPDSKSVSAYAVTAMKWATYKGIINGSDGMLLPAITASRAQVAQIVMNFCQKIAGL